MCQPTLYSIWSAPSQNEYRNQPMKHITKFSEFLNDTVNLNQTRIDVLKSRTETIQKFMKASSYEPDILEFSAQGSWAHKTIIKPVKTTNEFDADIVVYVDEVDGWEAKDYIEKLYKIFRDNSTYRPLVSRKSRCVTIDYAGDFHLDIVPVTVSEHIFSRPKVTRLIKYLRDTKTTFSCKSILLTTLIGNMINEGEVLIFQSTLGDGFQDVPTTLKTVLGRLDEYLQKEQHIPDIKNPILNEESFTRNWTDDQYINFRNTIHKYRKWIDDAYDEPNPTESVRKWRKLFGDDFAKDVILEVAKTKAIATNHNLKCADPHLFLEEMKVEADGGAVDTNKLLQLIHLGIGNQIDWEAIIVIAQASFDSANNDTDRDVAKINLYQVYGHRGIALSQPIIEDIKATIFKNSESSAFKLCGNLLLGTATKEMVDACIASGLYDDVLSWPIMKLMSSKGLLS